MVGILSGFFSVLIFAAIAFILWTAAFMAHAKSKKILREDKFEQKYVEYLLAYKISILKEELADRKVNIEKLDEFISEIVNPKHNKQHVLDVIEQEVKGEVEKASPKASRGKK